MFYSPTGSCDFFLSLAARPPTSCTCSFSTVYSSSLWRTDTIVCNKLNKPPSKISPASNGFEINKPPGRLIENLWNKLRAYKQQQFMVVYDLTS